MAEPSQEHSAKPARGRLAVGLLLVVLVAAALAFGLGRLHRGRDPGRVVFVTDTGVFLRELGAGRQERIAGLPKDTLEASPSPDGRWLAYLRRQGALWMLDLADKRRWQVSERLSAALGWTPDNRLVAGELGSGHDLVTVDPGSRGTRLLAHGYRGGRPIWRDRNRFVAALGHDTIAVRVSADGTSVSKLTDDAWPLALSPDGAELLYDQDPETDRPSIAIAKLRGDRLGPPRVVFEGWAKVAAVSPQGFVAFSARDRSNRAGTWVLESRSRPPRRLTAAAVPLAWSLDGSSLLYVTDGSLYARDLSEDRTIRLSTKGTYVKGFGVVP